VIRDRRPELMSVSEVLAELTEGLREQLRRELEYETEKLVDRRHWLTLEQIFIDKRVYRQLESAETEAAIVASVWAGMEPWAELLIRPMDDDDVKRLLELRIRRISAYDLERSRAEVTELAERIEQIEVKLQELTRTTIAYLEELIQKYGEAYPRRTRMAEIEAVDKKAVARDTIKLSYDRETGFFGSAVRGDHYKMSVSEFGLVLAISSDGSYRVMPPVEKVLLSGKLLYCAPFDPGKGEEFTVVYRDSYKLAFAKRFKIEKFIRAKEYQLIKDSEGRIDLLIAPEKAGVVALTFKPAPRQRVKGMKFDLRELESTSPTARGRRLSSKPVSKLSLERRPAPRKRQAKARPAASRQLSLDDTT
jgi:topoisomerase-4 subunit A